MISGTKRLRELENNLLWAAQTGSDHKDYNADFGEYVRLTQDRFIRKATRIIGSCHAAEDAVQEAYAALHEHLFVKRGQRDGLVSISSWVMRVAMTNALDHRRSAKRQEMVPLDAVKDSGMVEDEDHAVEEDAAMSRMWERVRSLPPRQQEVFMLRAMDHLKHAEIARRLGISSTAVRQAFCKARKELRKGI